MALVAAFQQGSLEAFSELYRRHRGLVQAVCRSRLHDVDLAEEAVQETFIRAFRALARYDGRQPVEHWLRRVARNHCIDVLRRRRREGMPDDHGRVIYLEDLRAEPGFERVENRAVARSVLEPLSRRDRELLVSHHADGVDVETLSRRWGMTQASVTVALHRARTRARRQDTGEVWGVAPIVWWWRNRRHAVERLLAASEQLGTSMQVTVAHLAVAMAVTASSVLGPATARAETPESPAAAVAGHDAGHDARTAQEHRPRPHAPATREPQGATRRNATQDIREPAAAPERSAPADPPVEVAPVEVPGTPLRVHRQRPSNNPRVQIGVRTPVESEPLVSVELHGEDEREFVAQQACDAATHGDPLTYCDR